MSEETEIAQQAEKGILDGLEKIAEEIIEEDKREFNAIRHRINNFIASLGYIELIIELIPNKGENAQELKRLYQKIYKSALKELSDGQTISDFFEQFPGTDLKYIVASSRLRTNVGGFIKEACARAAEIARQNPSRIVSNTLQNLLVFEGIISRLHDVPNYIEKKKGGYRQAEEKAAVPVHEQNGRYKLLVVDDDDSVRMLNRSMLEKLGYEVVEAKDGEQALGLLEGGLQVYGMVTDLSMPGIGGEELAKRTREKGYDMPIIVITGNEVDESLISRLSEHGVGAAIRKPYAFQTLKRSLKDHVDPYITINANISNQLMGPAPAERTNKN